MSVLKPTLINLFVAVMIIIVAVKSASLPHGNNISVVDGVVQCGALKCPNGTDTCEIRESSDVADGNKIETLIQCTKNGTIVDSKNSTVYNPSGNVVDNVFYWSDSGVSSCVNCGLLNGNFSVNLPQQMIDFQIEMSNLFGNLTENLKNMFEF